MSPTLEATDLKCRLAREPFAEAVSWVAKNLPSKPLAPITAGVLLSGSDDGLTVSGFDYEVSAEAQIAAEVTSFGSVLVSGRLLSAITGALPKKPIELSVDGSRVALTCGTARFSLPTMAIEDYPILPALPDDTGSLPADLFAEAITQVAVAASKDESLPQLTGIRVQISGDKLVLAATDRFRLAVRELTWEPLIDDVEAAVLVPAKTLADGVKASDGSAVRLSLGAGAEIGAAGILGISGGGRRATTRLIDAEFPQFRQLLPAEHTSVATINVAELTEAIKLVAVVAERGAQIILEFTDGALHISAGGEFDSGRAEQDLPIDFVGTPLRMAFNPAYLADGLGSVYSEFVSIGLTQPSRPAVLRPVYSASPTGDGPFQAAKTDYVHLVMPVKLPG